MFGADTLPLPGRADDVASLVLDSKTDPNSSDAQGMTPLMLAALQCHWEVVWFLLRECGATAKLRTRGGKTAIHFAAGSGDVDTIDLLLSEGTVDVNATDQEGRTALMMAARSGHKDAVQYFIQDAEADPHVTSNKGRTALMLAAQNGHENVVEFLVSGARVKADQRGSIRALPTLPLLCDAPH